MSQYLPLTRKEIRQHVGRLMDKVTIGTALGGTTASVTLDAVKRYPDTHFSGKTLSVVQGAAVGQLRVVTGSVQTDGVAFVEPVFTTAVAVGNEVEIWDEDLHPDRVNNAINLAILDAQEFCQVAVRVPPTSLSADRLEAVLPDTLTKVHGVSYHVTGQAPVLYEHVDLKWPEEHPYGWTVAGRTLYLSPAPPATVTVANLFVDGYRAPLELDVDSALSEVRPDYLIYLAAFLLESGEVGSQVTDPMQHGPRAAGWLRQALTVRERMLTSWEPNTVEVGPA